MTWVAGLALLLGACAAEGGLEGPAGDAAGSATATPAAAVDWSRATIRTLRIRQSEFTPLVFTLRQGSPYVLKLENGDDAAHAFSAPGFFQAIAVHGLGGQPLEPGMELSSIELAAGETRELAFVPLRDGRYSFADGWGGRLLGGLAGTNGLIVIEAKGPR
jgi:uncharacterized cupredoxin-like copper-binding protein